MKKRILFCFIASLIIFINAEPWEGTGAVAPGNELPITGYYIATDSFPGNTVVDITNIETGKSTRVMVANRLGKPDFLAIVSRQAAELIGMRDGSVTSIRMVQVTEPFASTDLSKRLATDIPAYNSIDMLTEELYNRDAYRLAQRSEPEESVAQTPPSYILEPEWRTRDVIVDLLHPDNLSAIVPIEKKPEEIVETPPEEGGEPVEIVKAEETEEFEEIVEVLPEEDEEPVEIVEAEETEEFEEIVEEISEKESPLVLVPAEERPPESLYGINPEDIIPGIKPPETEAAVETLVDENPPQIVVTEQMFSVPRITELDRGKFYVQIAAFDSAKSVEDALKQIDLNYQPVIYKDGDVWYRILLGPLNQGESAALLQRFKSIGYSDAFVRHVR
jgi:cell division protein FtsN